MPCCCVRVLNLCNVPVCGVLELDQLPVDPPFGEENNYKLVLDFMETQTTLTEVQQLDQSIHFDVSELNENYEYTGQVFAANGDLVSIDVDGVIYDCIKFKTVMNVLVGA